MKIYLEYSDYNLELKYDESGKLDYVRDVDKDIYLMLEIKTEG